MLALKTVPNFKDYSCTIDGRIYSHKSSCFMIFNIGSGYNRLGLRISGNGKKTYYKVSRLMAHTYLNLDLDDSDITVDHIDRNRLNDKIDNLRLLSLHDNILHRDGRLGIDTGTHKLCYDCKSLKLRIEFSKCSQNLDGLKGLCKVCQSKVRYQINHRDI